MAVEIDLGAVVPIHKGDWSVGTKYERANIVRYDSTAWICKVKESIGVEPSEQSVDWALVVKDVSSVSSVNGQRGDVTLDITHSVTQPLGTKDTTNATTEFVDNTISPISSDVSSLKNTIENNTIIKDNTSIIGSANKIPVAGANGKIDSSWLPDSVGSGHPLGYEFASLYVPEGCLLCNGMLYDKATYADLFALKQKEGRVVTEAKWQEIARASGGYCAMYADNGSNFRVPKPAPYLKMVLDAAKAGEYEEAGLPNITGKFSLTGTHSEIILHSSLLEGAFLRDTGGYLAWGSPAPGSGGRVVLDASRSSPIYGNSTTVTPENTSCLWVVQAFGVATNVGNADVSDALAKFGAIQAALATKLPDSTVHIIETWRSPNGNAWYEKWSDGKIRQGGNNWKTAFPTKYTITFPTPFRSKVLSLLLSHGGSATGGGYTAGLVVDSVTLESFQSIGPGNGSNINNTCSWLAEGY